jgi:2'-5' RNA ligase
MPRLFVGLEIPARSASAVACCAAAAGRALDRPGKLSHHAALHRRHRRPPRARDRLLLDGVKRRSFEVRFGELTSFGGRKPRAIVAAVEPIQPLVELQAELERLMQRLGSSRKGASSRRM